jgi:hypothetical protein
MLVLLFKFVFRNFLKSRQSLVPKLREVVPQKRNAFGVQFVDAPGAGATVADEAGTFEYAQMLRNGGTRHRETGRQFVDGARLSAEHFKDGEAGGVAKCREAMPNVSSHLP